MTAKKITFYAKKMPHFVVPSSISDTAAEKDNNQKKTSRRAIHSVEQ